MKFLQFLLMLILFWSCDGRPSNPKRITTELTSVESINQQLQSIIDEYKVGGSILVYDEQKNQYYSNDFDWAKQGQLPASTFKIPNSIIALESGVIENEQTIFKWDGTKRNMEIWESDLTLKEAFHVSCVPCYQEVARKVGVHQMKELVKKLGFGEMDIHSNNIDEFWLTGKSRISPYQQIDFLKRFYAAQLPIAKRTETLMKKLMIVEEKGQYTLRAKTGLSNEEGDYNGWYVGYIEMKETVYFFATNIVPIGEVDWRDFIKKRKRITFEALKAMNII